MDEYLSCISMLPSSSTDYWWVYNVCHSDTSTDQLKVPFPVTSHIILSINHNWFQSVFSFSNETNFINYIFSLSYNLSLDYLWPWYVTFDLINKWRFLCCIYDTSLVEIHHSMWTVWLNVNFFYRRQQQQRTDNSGETYPDVSFLLRQATQKSNTYK